jgi:hypothetical protein
MNAEDRLARMEMLLLYLIRKQQETSAKLQCAIPAFQSPDALIPESAMKALRKDMDVSITESQALLATLGLLQADHDLGELLNQIEAAARAPQN